MPNQHANRIRIVSVNLCLSGRGGNLLIQAPLLASAALTALAGAAAVWTRLLRPYGAPRFLVPLPVALGWIAAPNIAQLYACLLWLTPWRTRLCEQYKRERVAEWFKQVQQLEPQPDIICIQEVTNMWFDCSYTTAILEKANQLGFLYSSLPPAGPRLPATLCNSGLIILSRHPIISKGHHLFSNQAWFDQFAVNRGCLHAAVDVPALGRFDIFTAHLAPNPEAIPNLLNIDNSKYKLMTVENNTALQQGTELCDFMQRQTTRPDGKQPSQVILIGDFNFRAPSSTYDGFVAILARHCPWGFTDAFEQAGTWPPTFGTVGPDGQSADQLLTQHADRCKPKTIDFAWLALPPSLRAQRPVVVPFAVKGQPFTAISDHCGLSVEIAASADCVA